ncbi:MAG: hydrogenase iron-sulfur subunit, partial [Dehalococcoidia bacterium]|nr:hydrogenase iron-sulfur subunit [Dehalococcoidia bacterium]
AAIEAIKELVDGVGGGGEEMEQALEAFDQIDELFNEKKIGEKLKEAGLDVTSAKAGSRDGWKTMEVKAAVKDLNAFLKKAEKDQKEEVEDLPIDLPFGDIGSMVPAFYKTSTQGVGKVVLIPAIGDLLNDASFDLEQLEDLADDELEQIEAQIDAALAKNPEEKVLTFACNWCSYAGADQAGVEKVQYPPSARIIRTMCSARVSERFVARAIDDGAGAVLITGCRLTEKGSDCHYIDANAQTEKRFNFLQRKYGRRGLEPDRFQLQWISASEGKELASKLREMDEIVQKHAASLTVQV